MKYSVQFYFIFCFFCFFTLEEDVNNKPDQSREKEMEDKFEKMIAGNMDNLPPLPRSVVRIFISSTFSGKIYKLIIIEWLMQTLQ